MKDVTLYKVSQDFEYIMDLLERDVLEDSEKERLQQELEKRIKENSKDIIAQIISDKSSEGVLTNEINRLKKMKKDLNDRQDKLKSRLTENMRRLKINKIETPLGKISLSLDGTIKSIEIKDGYTIDNIPEEYIRVKKELNKTDIKKALSSGVEINGIEIIEQPSQARYSLSDSAKNDIEEMVGDFNED